MKPSDYTDDVLIELMVAGEATADETAEWQRRVSARADLEPMLTAQRNIDAALAAAYAERRSAMDSAPPIPADLLKRINAVDHGSNVIAFGELQATKNASLLPKLAIAASVALLAGASALYFLGGLGGRANAVAVLSPGPTTGLTQPAISWPAEDGPRDVWILAEGASQQDSAPLFVAKNVTPPLTFGDMVPGQGLPAGSPSDALLPGTGYQVLICAVGMGRHAGVAVPFKTLPDASSVAIPADPAGAFLAVKKMLDAERPADALSAIIALPDSTRNLPEIKALEGTARDALR